MVKPMQNKRPAQSAGKILVHVIYWDGGDDDGLCTSLGAFSSEKEAQELCDKFNEDSMNGSGIRHEVKSLVLDKDIDISAYS